MFGRRWRAASKGSFGAGLLLALVLVAPAAAETYYAGADFKLEGTGARAARRCVATISPILTFGAAAPLIAIKTADPARPRTLSIAIANADQYADLVVVEGNRRLPLTSGEMTGPTELRRFSLAAALQSGIDFFVTGTRRSTGEIVSSRFSAPNLSSLYRRMEEFCPFQAEPWLNDGTARGLAETRLPLSTTDRIHIRWVLNSLNGVTDDPGFATTLTDAERNYLLQYTVANGLPVSRYLTAQSASVLLNIDLSPVDDFVPYIRETPGYRVFADWFYYKYNSDSGEVFCGIGTRLEPSDPRAVWEQPYMFYVARESGEADALILDMVSPNPFETTRPVQASVDGRVYPLQFGGSDTVRPATAPSGEGLDNAVLVATRQGQAGFVSGTAGATGRALQLHFSARGFTAAFNAMIAGCNRPTLAGWIGNSAGSSRQVFTFRACNDYFQSLDLAVAYYNGVNWVTKGWWGIPARQCENIGSFPRGTFYVYGVTSGFFWGGGDGAIEACLPFDAFNTVVRAGTCRSDERRASLSRYSISDPTWEFTFKP